MDHGYNGGQPGVSFVGDDDAYQQEQYYDEVFPEAKPATKKGKKTDKTDKNDKSTKEKKPATPIVPSYEGYLFTVLDATRPGETASWVRTHKTQMPLTSQELYNKAVAHKKDSGLGFSGQFQALGPNQQILVNRLVDEKNAAEKEPNAAWTLFGVRKMYKEQKTTFKTWRINDAIRVTIKRGDKAKDVVRDIPSGQTQLGEIDKANIVDLREPVKKEKQKEKKEEKEKDAAPKKKKKQQAANVAQDYYNDQQYGDYQQNDYAQNVDPYPPYENTQPQQQQQWQQQPQQQHHDPFAQPQHDPFSTYDMSGALPAEGAIPVPPHQYQPQQQQHDYRPEAPMPPQQPQYQHENPFQSDPRVFPQAKPAFDPFQVDERQSRNPVAHGQQPFSARRPSHSRQRSLSRPRSLSRRRDSVDSERRHAEEARKLADVVRNEVRGVMREVAAEDKVLNRWHTRSGSGSAGSSSRSTAPEDFWSQAGSSGDRRFSYNSTPGTSPDRGERYHSERRPTDHFRRRDSSGPRPYVDDRRRYYMEKDRNYVVKPHETYREHGRDREPRYLRDRRQSYDDYPLAHQQRSPRERQYERPRIQRRVTDYPEAFHDADFGRSSGRGVDYERTRPHDRDDRDRRRYAHEERPGRRDRDRQPAGHWL